MENVTPAGMDADQVVPLVVRRGFVRENTPTHQVSLHEKFRAVRDDGEPKVRGWCSNPIGSLDPMAYFMVR
jgi:hypothetical protein